MATATVDEIVTKINQLPKSDRDELLRRLKESPRENAESTARKSNGRKGRLHPNTIWIKENKHKYPGNYVALKDGELIAVGRTIKDADLAAKAKGVNDPLLHYILPDNYEPWGGW